ncbi:MAG TPA: hypothetical protein VGV35_11875, partial [Bryobacteraceae bacterium]|nr:hypothetical protein [Bryobacteraceae bacterium]
MIPESLSPIANHLWQSTFFAGGAGLLTLALRKNAAGARYWLWLASSFKFLIPLSLLVALGSHIGWSTASTGNIPPNFPAVMEGISQPFTAPPAAPHLANVRPTGSPLPAILSIIWGCGFIQVAITWWLRWRPVRSAVRAASTLPFRLDIPVVSSAALLEPGVFGVFRPILLLPEGIIARLTPAQLDAVIAH